MIKEIKEKLAFKWALRQVNKLENKSKKAWKSKNSKGKWNVGYMSDTLPLEEFQRWEELKKYVYSYRTRDSKHAKDLTRAKFNPKYGKDAGRPSIEDINYSLNEAPTDRPFKEDPPERLYKGYLDTEQWIKTLPDGRTIMVSNEEYQEARKKAGLAPMPPSEYKIETE